MQFGSFQIFLLDCIDSTGYFATVNRHLTLVLFPEDEGRVKDNRMSILAHILIGNISATQSKIIKESSSRFY
jgi:hypothetical protein